MAPAPFALAEKKFSRGKLFQRKESPLAPKHLRIQIKNWEKHNPRKDYKRPVWFAVDNRMIEDPKFYDFTGDEFRAWIYLLSQASQQNSDSPNVFVEHAERVCLIPKKAVESAIKKLSEFQMLTSICTDDERDPNASVRDLYSTNKQTNKQDEYGKPGFALDSIFGEYPKRKGDHGKKAAFQRLSKILKSEEDVGRAREAAKNYRKHCDAEKLTGTPFVKRFSTWVGVWEEWETASLATNKKPARTFTADDLTAENENGLHL